MKRSLALTGLLAYALAQSNDLSIPVDATAPGGLPSTTSPDPSVITVELRMMGITAVGTVDFSGYQVSPASSTTIITTAVVTSTLTSTVTVTAESNDAGAGLESLSSGSVDNGDPSTSGSTTWDAPYTVTSQTAAIPTSGSEAALTESSPPTASPPTSTQTLTSADNQSNQGEWVSAGETESINFSSLPTASSTGVPTLARGCVNTAGAGSLIRTMSAHQWVPGSLNGTAWQPCSSATSTGNWTWPALLPLGTSPSFKDTLPTVAVESFLSSAESLRSGVHWSMLTAGGTAWLIWHLTLM